jgi:hypothetical protein
VCVCAARPCCEDFYRKIPRDMSEGTIPGSVISMCAAVMIALLLVSEVNSYVQPIFKTKVVVDRSVVGSVTWTILAVPPPVHGPYWRSIIN